MNLFQMLLKNTLAGKKQFAVLIDPDKYTQASLSVVVQLGIKAGVDYFLIGGSLLTHDTQSVFISYIKEQTTIPVVLFPGNNLQLNNQADGILLLSLISGRNPDLLIGRHVISAPFLKASKLEVISTGYMLIESGRTTSVGYMSNTTPIPSHKDDIAVCTAMAGEMLGMKVIYMDAGSGAVNPVPLSMISKVKASIGIPLIIGGGITSPELAKAAYGAGADLIVVGNGIESDPELLTMIAAAR
ncbi:MAG: geranylgeranylglyceryl/heptaprenylglyceryl phosphate synthase [Bacteroidales bacterium]